jgi:hypothetical protein
MQGSAVSLSKATMFASDIVSFTGKGVFGTASFGAVSNIDLVMTDDCFLTGGVLRTNGSFFGDYADMQVVDKDNILGYGAGAVLNQFITKWYMRSDAQEQFETSLSYPSKIYAGLYLRVVYHSVGATNVEVAMNYELHKALY